MLYPETKKALLEFIGLSPAFVDCNQQQSLPTALLRAPKEAIDFSHWPHQTTHADRSLFTNEQLP